MTLLSRLFARKPISSEESGLKRVLGAGDLVLLGIGAVIGAGIFGSIGTAACGQVDAAGNVIRLGAGPALVISFLLLGLVCTLTALCYAELASMLPQSGSAYGYTYASLGELVAWIIGWDLILEYAVGNVAVAISWADYLRSFLHGWVDLPAWLTTGYRTALLSADPAVHGLLDTAPKLFGWAVLINLPAFTIVALVTWLLLMGAKESAWVNRIMVFVKLGILAIFLLVGLGHINTDNYVPFAPNGWPGIHQGAAIVFFAYIGFDAISTAAEETKNPQRNMPIGILGGLAACTVIYIAIGLVLTGLVPYTALGVSDPLAHALELANMTSISRLVAFGAVVSMAAVLLVFQYGQSRIFYVMARDGLIPSVFSRLSKKSRVPHITTLITGVFVALWSLVGDAGETYDLTNIGTLFAFLLVCGGVLVLRYQEPNRPRPFKVPLVWFVSLSGIAACLYTMAGLPAETWERFAIWLIIGLVLYFAYGFRSSALAEKSKS